MIMTNEIANHINTIETLFPWYKNLIRNITHKVHDIGQLPIIDQRLLEEYYYINPGHFPNAMTYHTSGTSSGVRKKIYYSAIDHELYLQHRTKIFKKFITASCRVACSDLGTGHAADSASFIFKKLGLETYKIDYTSTLEEHIRILNMAKPDVFFVMPMILQKLINTNELKIAPKKIFLVGDVATKIWQENIANYFEIPPSNIIDLFGSIEIGSIAFYNHDVGLYQFEEHIIPEVINVDKDKSSILLLTSIARTYFPAIRFKTNDIISNFHSTILNGRQTWFFEHCIGRAGEEYKAGEKISFYDLLACVEKVVPSIPFNVAESDYRIEILIPKSKITPKQIDKLYHELRNVNPDIKRMIESGLTPDFKIVCVDDALIDEIHFKRKVIRQNSISVP